MKGRKVVKSRDETEIKRLAKLQTKKEEGERKKLQLFVKVYTGKSNKSNINLLFELM
jgi:hypothetical protein